MQQLNINITSSLFFMKLVVRSRFHPCEYRGMDCKGLDIL